MPVRAPVPIASPGLARAAIAGLAALLVGIGLARFAYGPLIPALIGAGWFTPAGAAYLGAANLLGYLAGVLIASWITARRPAAVLRAMLLLTAASLIACAFPALGYGWFVGWRLVSGVTGGVIMLLAAPTVLAVAPAEARGRIGGVMFMGVGLGIVASGTIVPLLLHAGGVQGAWLGLGALALLLTMLGWRGWPAAPFRHAPAARGGRAAAGGLAVNTLVLVYALSVVGIVPHMIFLADYVARGLGRGMGGAAAFWALYGIGAALGPVVAGWLADRLGFAAALRAVLVAQALAVALPLASSGGAALALSSAVVGALTIGIVPLVLGRVHDLVEDPLARRAAWARATMGYALAQAGAAYAFSWLFGRTGDYRLLFAFGAAALVAAAAVDLAGAAAAATGRALLAWQRRARERHRLAMLNARALADIGLSERDARRESRKPFWRR